jgi:hypothetical protein
MMTKKVPMKFNKQIDNGMAHTLNLETDKQKNI